MNKIKEEVLKGIPAASGIAMGPIFILDKQDFIVSPRAIMEKEVPLEIARFEEALIKTREEIMGVQEKIAKELGSAHAQIFDAHLLVLEDRTLIEEVIKHIKIDKLSVEYTFNQVLKKYIKIFAKMQDDYLRERTSDISDVGRRVLKNLIGETKLHEIENLTENLVIAAHDISPSDTASMFNKNIIAFVTDIGGRTSHTAIMAKSLGIPAVVGLKDVTMKVGNQDEVIVDGRMGLVIVNPTESTKEIYHKEQERIRAFKNRFLDIKDLESRTKDGREIKIMANIELPEEVMAISDHGAAGIGLYRTEFFYMNRIDLPSEEEQFEAYKLVVQKMDSKSVVVRSLDLGGDKFISALEIPRDMHPSLGWRAIRFCLARPDIFKTQLRAILRASAYGKLKLMYPLISGCSELAQANAILEEIKTNLREHQIPFDEQLQVGVMIEVPSAALTADAIAKKADFFSIGTNDLVQYALAVDRTNEQTAYLYEPGHPAILRLIKETIDAAHRNNIPVSVCGEMASEPAMALLLVGFGVDELSMPFLNILQIKKLVRSINYEEAQKVAEKAMTLSTGKEVEEFAQLKLKEMAGEVYALDKEIDTEKP